MANAVKKAIKEIGVPPEHLVRKVFKGPEVSKESKVQLGYKVYKVFKVLKVIVV